jgi:uncharacterized membrane protein YhhN
MNTSVSPGFFSWAAVCALGCVIVLLGEHHRHTLLTVLGKILAASAYIAAALSLGALESVYGRLVLVAMAFCWAGDLLLVSRSSRGLFLGGLSAFLLGHVVYSFAFSVRGLVAETGLMALAVMGLFMWFIMRWLKPHLDDRMRVPVLAYLLAISVMMATAAGSWAAHGSLPLLFGAILFVASDVTVARNRFVAPGIINRVWGLPTYFVAQLLLAASIAQ